MTTQQQWPRADRGADGGLSKRCRVSFAVRCAPGAASLMTNDEVKTA